MYLIDKNRDDPRRRTLIQMLAMGHARVLRLLARWRKWRTFFGSRPAKLPPGQSIYRISGTATINDKPAALGTKVVPGDTVKTGKDSELVFVVNTKP